MTATTAPAPPERRASGPRLRVVRRDNLPQRRPRHHAFHLFQELALARLLGRQVQAKSELLHGQDRRWPGAITQRGSALSYAALPWAVLVFGRETRATTGSAGCSA